MSKTSRPPSFAAALNEKTAQDQEALADYRRRTEDAANEQLRELGAICRARTEANRERYPAPGRPDDRGAGAPEPVVGLGVCMAIWSSLWAIGQWQHRQIEQNIELLLHIDQQIEERRQTLRELNQE